MKKKGDKEQSVKVWGKFEENKLRELFETAPSKGGVDPEDTTKKTLEKIIATHYPGRNYHSFRQLFRKKALKYLLAQRLSGRRKEVLGK